MEIIMSLIAMVVVWAAGLSWFNWMFVAILPFMIWLLILAIKEWRLAEKEYREAMKDAKEMGMDDW